MENRSGNLSRYARDAASGIGLPRFWRWWMAELKPVVPAASRSAMRALAHAAGHRVRRTRSGVLAPGNSQRRNRARGDGQGAVARRPGRRRGGRARGDGLDRRGCAGQRGVAAAASRRRLAAAAGDAQAHGAARGRRGESRAGARRTISTATRRFDPSSSISTRSSSIAIPRAKTITVDWVAALKTVVDGARRQAEAWGASVQAVIPGPASTMPPQLNLMPPEERPRAGSWRRWQVWVPLVLLAAVALAALLVPLVQKREYAIALNKQAEEARVQALAADAVRTQLERAQGDYNFVLAKKYAYPGTVQLLDDVTRVLPDDTWVTQLEMRTSLRGKETAARAGAARRIGERRQADRPARGFEAGRAGGAALADDQDSAGTRRDLRSRRTGQEAGAARAGAAVGDTRCRTATRAAAAPARGAAASAAPAAAAPALPTSPPACARGPARSGAAVQRRAHPPRHPVAPAAPARRRRCRRRASRPRHRRAWHPQHRARRRRRRPAKTRNPTDGNARAAYLAALEPRTRRVAAGRRRGAGAGAAARAGPAAAPALRRRDRRHARSPGALSPRRRAGAGDREALDAMRGEGRPPLLPEEHRAESRRRRAAGPGAGGDREQRRPHHDGQNIAPRTTAVSGRSASTCSSSRRHPTCRRSCTRSRRSSRT